MCTGVFDWLLRAWQEAWRDTSSSMSPRWPSKQAMCKVVLRLLVIASTLPPRWVRMYPAMAGCAVIWSRSSSLKDGRCDGSGQI